ncbi:acid protease [Amanita rubescens]|nr:acid protease [Amanita rubescens]
MLLTIFISVLVFFITAQGFSTVPLRGRTSLTRENGVFDYNKALRDITSAKNKHRQNLINLERNLGREASLHVRQSGSEPLTDENQDTEWAGTVSIGTPSQMFLVDFDTGSSDLWYDASNSNTSKLQSGSFSIQYGDGSQVKGNIYRDTVSVAGVKATGQYFAAATNISFSFADTSVDGILGLAFQGISNLHQPPFFQTASSQGNVSPSSFAFFLSSNNSELHLGGTNKTLYTGSIEYHTIVNTSSINVNSSSAVLSSFDTIIDSGTTIIVGPPDAVNDVYNAVPDSEVFDESNGLYAFPCDAVPEVSFTWDNGSNWVISSNNFNLGQTMEGSEMCVGAIIGMDLGLGKNVWLLGDSFMKNVYTVFDTGNSSVGFAKLSKNATSQK